MKTLTKSKRFGLSFVLGAALVALVPVQASAQVDPLIQKFQNWINMVDGIKYTAQQGNNITPASQPERKAGFEQLPVSQRHRRFRGRDQPEVVRGAVFDPCPLLGRGLSDVGAELKVFVCL